MKIPVAWLVWVVVAVFAATLLWLFLLWQPNRQVELHTRDFLARASARDWPAVAGMMAADYRDDWDQTREGAVETARTLFSNFFVLHIRPLDPWKIDVGAEGAEVSARIGVFGTGTAVAEMVMEEVRAVEEPTVFRWRKSGSWPWDWELTGAGNEALAGRYPR